MWTNCVDYTEYIFYRWLFSICAIWSFEVNREFGSNADEDHRIIFVFSHSLEQTNQIIREFKRSIASDAHAFSSKWHMHNEYKLSGNQSAVTFSTIHEHLACVSDIHRIDTRTYNTETDTHTHTDYAIISSKSSWFCRFWLRFDVELCQFIYCRSHSWVILC